MVFSSGSHALGLYGLIRDIAIVMPSQAFEGLTVNGKDEALNAGLEYTIFIIIVESAFTLVE